MTAPPEKSQLALRVENTIATLRKVLKEIMHQKPNSMELSDCARRASLLMASLKIHTSKVFSEIDERHKQVQEKKRELEAYNLQLQNLMYEKNHLSQEIKRCQGFNSKELKKIGLDKEFEMVADLEHHKRQMKILTDEMKSRTEYVSVSWL